MKEKKQSSNTYIAITHWLTAKFAVPILVYVVALFALPFVLPAQEVGVYEIVYMILIPIAVWLGTMYSASYVNKTYVIRDSSKIINISLGISLVIEVVSTIWDLTNNVFLIQDSLIALLAIAIFYLVSKKYIKNTV